MKPKALLFDFDGTIAETERHGHRVAYQRTFDELGLGWVWGEALYGELLAVAGGKERVRAFVLERGATLPEGWDLDETIARIHARKGVHFAQLASSIPLRPGVARLTGEAAAAGLPIAIVTTAAPEGVDALLAAHPAVRDTIGVVAAGDVVEKKKPAPDIYTYALAALGLAADDALAVEDSAIGLRAARAAGVATLVTRSSYTRGEEFAGAIAVLDGLGEPDAPAHTVSGPRLPKGFVDLDYLRSLFR